MADFPGTPVRLRFIDMARAVAILLMLEGHFVHQTLADEWRISGQPLYEAWLHVRGLAAPMFYMVTGLIFSYLLSGAPAQEPFFRIRRVRRGLKRFVELILWGYLLQFQPILITGEAGPPTRAWFVAFHVFQCIAIGLLTMIITFGLLRKAGSRAVIAGFITLGFCTFLLSVVLANRQGYWPEHAPAILQNIVQGPTSHFSIAPWLGFTFYGAALGTYIRHRQKTRADIIHPAGFLLVGALLSYKGWHWDARIGRTLLDILGHHEPDRVTPFFFHARFGESLIFLGIIIAIDKWSKLNLSWLQTVGRNTFAIYIGHVIVLYGGITGIGLNRLWDHSLDPWQAAGGALVFCLAFAVYAQAIEPAQKQLMKTWANLRNQAADR